MQHVSWLVVCMCGALRRLTTTKKVKRVHTDGLRATKDGRRGFDRGTESWWTIRGWLTLGDIDEEVYVWRSIFCWPTQDNS
jgi:hypothetical protein